MKVVYIKQYDDKTIYLNLERKENGIHIEKTYGAIKKKDGLRYQNASFYLNALMSFLRED